MKMVYRFDTTATGVRPGTDMALEADTCVVRNWVGWIGCLCLPSHPDQGADRDWLLKVEAEGVPLGSDNSAARVFLAPAAPCVGELKSFFVAARFEENCHQYFHPVAVMKVRVDLVEQIGNLANVAARRFSCACMFHFCPYL